MEAAAVAAAGGSVLGSPGGRNSWRYRKTNILVAMPTLLTLYFIGAVAAFVICTRTFASFSQDSQAPVQLFRGLNSSSYEQAVLEEVQVPRARAVVITNATELDFMQTPVVRAGKIAHAVALQRKLKDMTSVERRRWLVENWSGFQILKEDNVSEQFDDRMRGFLANSTERFFLTWISPVSTFSPRERLGLESIFKHHPLARVVFLSRAMDSRVGAKLLAPFRARGYHVAAVTPNLTSLFSGIPAAKWLSRLREGTGDPGCINLMQNLSNLMRLAALYKYGGVYLDTDVIVLKSFAPLRNAVGAQSQDVDGHWTRLNNAVLVFDRAHPLLLELMREFVATFDGSRWGWNGPYLVSRVATKVLEPVHKWQNCSDVAILPMIAFYPVNWIDIVKFFRKPIDDVHIKWQESYFERITNATYSLHLWNKMSSHLEVQSGSIMETLFKRSCLFCTQGSES